MPTNEQFETWLATVPEFISDLGVLLRDETVILDFSLESLIPLEAYILKRFPSIDNFRMKENSGVANLLACYVGECILQHCAGHWKYQDDPNYVHFGRPVIEFPTRETASPLSLVATAIDRRRGDLIYNNVKRKGDMYPRPERRTDSN